MKTIPSHSLYAATESGNIIRISTGRQLRPYKNKWGYSLVTLSANNIKTRHSVHRLVMEAFCGKSDLPVDHINNDKADNRLSNLRYITTSENNRRSHAQGRSPKRNRIAGYDIRFNRAMLVLSLRMAGMRNCDVASITGVSMPSVSDITAGRTWPEASRIMNREANK